MKQCTRTIKRKYNVHAILEEVRGRQHVEGEADAVAVTVQGLEVAAAGRPVSSNFVVLILAEFEPINHLFTRNWHLNIIET